MPEVTSLNRCSHIAQCYNGSMKPQKDKRKSRIVWSLLICLVAIVAAVHFQNLADLSIAQSPFFSTCYSYSSSDTDGRGNCVLAELPAYTSAKHDAESWRTGMVVIAVISGLVFLASLSSPREKMQPVKREDTAAPDDNY